MAFLRESHHEAKADIELTTFFLRLPNAGVTLVQWFHFYQKFSWDNIYLRSWVGCCISWLVRRDYLNVIQKGTFGTSYSWMIKWRKTVAGKNSVCSMITFISDWKAKQNEMKQNIVHASIGSVFLQWVGGEEPNSIFQVWAALGMRTLLQFWVAAEED